MCQKMTGIGFSLFSCELSLGDLQSEEGRDVVLEIVLPALAAPTQDTVLKATLSYFNVISSTMETASYELAINRAGINLDFYIAA